MNTLESIRRILDRVRFLDREFHVMPKGDGFLIQLSYYEADIHTGKREIQKSRKHYVSPWMTVTEIVDTVFYMVMRSQEHVTREHFTYDGIRVQSPHFHINARMTAAACEDKREDER